MAWNVGSGTSWPSARTRGRRTATLRPPQHDFTAHGPGPRGVALSRMHIPWPAEGDAIFFEHRFQHLQTRSDREFEQLTARIDEQIDQGRGRGDSTADERRTVPDSLMAAPFL